MYCAFSLPWGQFGRNTRSAIRGTSSSLGHLSVFGRCFVARYKRGKRSGNLKKSTFFVNIPNFIHLGGRAYPVRHYPVAIRLRTRNSTPHQFTKLVGDPVGVRHSMYCTISSEWGLFGCNTRSAFRRTPSFNKQHFLKLGVLRSFLGSSLVYPWSLTRERQARYKGKES